jgi:hypothetical protein
MSRHIPRHERWSKLGPTEYRSGSAVVRYERRAWWALVSYQRRDEDAAEEQPAAWHAETDCIGPFKRPRNAMIAAEERVLLLRRQGGDRVRL